MRVTEACGCKHNGREWLLMCAPCKAEWQERHERAAREHGRPYAGKEVHASVDLSTGDVLCVSLTESNATKSEDWDD